MATDPTLAPGAQSVAVTTALKLAPSDFAFLWEECRRCFWLKVARGIARPHTPMPSIFVQIDSAMKDFFMKQRVERVVPALPPGRFAYAGKWVESRPIATARGLDVYVRGPFDTVIAFDDGSHAIIDFKTSSQKAENIAKYARQLHAYAYAMENPSARGFPLARVERMGLLVYEPRGFEMRADGAATLGGSVQWVEMQKDEGRFLRFLDEVADVLAARDAPEPGAGCTWCRFRAETRAHPF